MFNFSLCTLNTGYDYDKFIEKYTAEHAGLTIQIVTTTTDKYTVCESIFLVIPQV